MCVFVPGDQNQYRDVSIQYYMHYTHTHTHYKSHCYNIYIYIVIHITIMYRWCARDSSSRLTISRHQLQRKEWKKKG